MNVSFALIGHSISMRRNICPSLIGPRKVSSRASNPIHIYVLAKQPCEDGSQSLWKTPYLPNSMDAIEYIVIVLTLSSDLDSQIRKYRCSISVTRFREKGADRETRALVR